MGLTCTISSWKKKQTHSCDSASFDPLLKRRWHTDTLFNCNKCLNWQEHSFTGPSCISWWESFCLEDSDASMLLSKLPDEMVGVGLTKPSYFVCATWLTDFLGLVHLYPLCSKMRDRILPMTWPISCKWLQGKIRLWFILQLRISWQ